MASRVHTTQSCPFCCTSRATPLTYTLYNTHIYHIYAYLVQQWRTRWWCRRRRGGALLFPAERERKILKYILAHLGASAQFVGYEGDGWQDMMILEVYLNRQRDSNFYRQLAMKVTVPLYDGRYTWAFPTQKMTARRVCGHVCGRMRTRIQRCQSDGATLDLRAILLLQRECMDRQGHRHNDLRAALDVTLYELESAL
jgi:hypothetical protein